VRAILLGKMFLPFALSASCYSTAAIFFFSSSSLSATVGWAISVSSLDFLFIIGQGLQRSLLYWTSNTTVTASSSSSSGSSGGGRKRILNEYKRKVKNTRTTHTHKLHSCCRQNKCALVLFTRRNISRLEKWKRGWKDISPFLSANAVQCSAVQQTLLIKWASAFLTFYPHLLTQIW